MLRPAGRSLLAGRYQAQAVMRRVDIARLGGGLRTPRPTVCDCRILRTIHPTLEASGQTMNPLL